MEKLTAQLNDALVERANLNDALKQNDLKVAMYRNALAGAEMAQQERAKADAEAKKAPVDPTE